MKENLAWETPSFELLRMDAEIGSYQDDSEPDGNVPLFVREEAESE